MCYYLLLGARPESGDWTPAQREAWKRYLARFFDQDRRRGVYVLWRAGRYGVTTAAALRTAWFKEAEWEAVEVAIPEGSGSPELAMRDFFPELVSRGLLAMTLYLVRGETGGFIQDRDRLRCIPQGDIVATRTFLREPDGTPLPGLQTIPADWTCRNRGYRSMRLT